MTSNGEHRLPPWTNQGPQDAPARPGASTSAQGAAAPSATAPGATTSPHARRRWLTPVIAVVALGIGAAAGAAGGTSDPTTSPEYERLAAEKSELETDVSDLTGRIEAAEAETSALESREAALDTRTGELDARGAELDTREGELVAREEAVTATENHVAATQIGNGIWTVGVDVEPGTYRVAEAVPSMCYWAILVTGTNGADIVDNDLPDGGFPTVTLREGQDFDNSCGVWNKQ